MDKLQKVKFDAVDIIGGFWADRQELNRKKTIFAVEDRFDETGRFEAFEFKWREGCEDVDKPHFFWDSDIAKWLESAAYMIAKEPDADLEARVEQVIDDIERHQDPNGYFNIYHTVVEPDIRFQNRDHHELYCLGHLLEAAIAYNKATGKDRFFKLMDKYVDHVIKRFCVDKDTGFLTPGHEEIELALCKAYEFTNDKKYLDLAKFFLDNRHLDHVPEDFWANDMYFQSERPVRELRSAEGHSVRANYLFCGMADVARYTDDEEMLTACKALFDDIAYGKMYVTGGIGSSHFGEAFTKPYDLPNDTAYTETCASIALALFANRMKDIDIDSKYADMVERQIFNGALSGVSLDGKSFFYENPLEINLYDRDRHHSVPDASDRLPITQRVEVFGCSCCPPNLTRFFASIGDFVFSYDDDRVFVHQFMPCSALVNGGEINIETDYPRDGKIDINCAALKGKKLYVRIPGWCADFTASKSYDTYKGYAVFDIDKDIFDLSIDLHIKPVFVAANPAVRADGNKVALLYGPVVYCAEGVDNDMYLADIRVDIAKTPVIGSYEEFGVPTLTADALIADREQFAGLYMPVRDVKKKNVKVRFIPYFAFANRGETDMRVWISY